MNRSHHLLAGAILVVAAALPRGVAMADVPSASHDELYLCTALEHAMEGQQVPVLISGVVTVGFEFQIFFDPEQPECGIDVQPSTWIEIPSSAKNREALFQSIEATGSANVTIRGVLYGPPVLGRDDSSLNPVAAFANRIAHRRYGHLGGFRTKLVVDEILEARPAPQYLAARARLDRPTSIDEVHVEAAQVPEYPERARRAGVSGEVVVKVAIQGGEVVSTELLSGDRLLAMGAEANIKTWKFAEDLEATFTTTFVYRLELRPTGAEEGSRIELQLPRLIRITAPRYAW